MQRPPRHHDLTPGLFGSTDNGDDPADIGGKGGHRNAVGRLRNKGRQVCSHFGFAGAFTILERVCGIAHQCQWGRAIFPDLLHARDVGGCIANRSRIKLPVAGMQHTADWRRDQQGIGFGDRMGDVDGLDGEWADLERLARPHDGNIDIFHNAIPCPLGSEHCRSERRAEDRLFKAGPKIEYGAVVIFVGMGKDQREDIVGTFFQKFGIGHDQFDPGQVGPAEGHAAINHDPLARALRAKAIGTHVHADLADAAQWHEDEFIPLVFSH